MTRDEAIKILKELAGYEKTMDLIQNYSVSVQDALYMAIKALEQEPKQRTGHWIEDAETYYKAIYERGCEPDENTPIFLDDIACSECLAKFSVIDNETERFECCPHCGAKMLEPQESEEA